MRISVIFLSKHRVCSDGISKYLPDQTYFLASLGIDILKIDAYADESRVQKEIQTICQIGNMSLPHEQVVKSFQWYEDDDRGADLVAVDKEFC